jgi:Tfp pilus assembly protein PilX
MMTSTRRRLRRGYTLTVVLIFLILLFALWSTVYRTTSSLLRIETNRTLQQTRDQGAMNALAQAIQLLQYSTPSDASNPGRTVFTYQVSVSVPNPSGGCETSNFTVQYSPAPTQGTNCWQVQVSPGTSSVPLPSIGATPQWP